MRLQHSKFLQTLDSTGFIPSGTQLDGTQSAWAASTNSAPFPLPQTKGYCIYVSWPSTGSPVGTIKLQGSVDDANNSSFTSDEKVVNWFDLDFPAGSGTVTQTVNGAGSAAFQDSDAMYRWVRLVWTRSSGSFTPTATIQIKGIN